MPAAPPAAGHGAAPARSKAGTVRPRRLSHILMFSSDVPRSVRFYADTLGLRLSDHSGDIIAFLHGAHGSDHHMIAFAKSDGPGLHHSSWDVATLDDVGLGMQQMMDRGHTHGWGVGRHVIGSNYFRYIRDPWGSFAEYSYDIDFIPATSTGRPRIIRRKIRSTSGGRRCRTTSSSITKRARRPRMKRTVRRACPWSSSALRWAPSPLAVGAASGAPSGPPIRIGSTLALTGPLASTALVHQLVGEIYVEQINKKNGLLGRPVEWIVKDDQSKPDLARTLYEQLITVDKVDLLMGPYATGAILSAMGVAQRYNKILIHHTFGIPSLAKYDAQFPTWSLGADPADDVPEHAARRARRDAEAAEDHRDRHEQVSVGPLHVARRARGREEARAARRSCSSNGSSATATSARSPARIKDANPDFVWVGAIGLEGNQLLDAMKKIDYTPPLHFYMYPAPGPMAQAPEGKNALAATIFEEHPPYLNNPGAAEFVKLFNERAAKAGLPYTGVETQAAASYSAWQVLDAAVTATKSLDDKVLADWLRKNKVDTIQGKLRFDGPSNYGDDLMVREAGAERPLGHRVAEERRGAGRHADDEVAGPARWGSRAFAACAVGAVGSLHRRPVRAPGPRPQPVVGAPAPDQPRALRAGVSRRVPLLSALDGRRRRSAR